MGRRRRHLPDVDLDTDDPEAKVSRRHARITLSNGQYFLEDLGSTNGTFINRGKRLPPDSVRHCAMATKSSSVRRFYVSTS